MRTHAKYENYLLLTILKPSSIKAHRLACEDVTTCFDQGLGTVDVTICG